MQRHSNGQGMDRMGGCGRRSCSAAGDAQALSRQGACGCVGVPEELACGGWEQHWECGEQWHSSGEIDGVGELRVCDGSSCNSVGDELVHSHGWLGVGVAEELMCGWGQRWECTIHVGVASAEERVCGGGQHARRWECGVQL